jgi:hypothetical protein
VTETILRRCHRCGMTITDGEPYEVDEFGWRHTIDCGWGGA